MVTVYFELERKDVVLTSPYFNNSYTDDWLDDWAKRVVREVDKSELISAELVKSPVLGPITIRDISHGSKALIMMKSDKTVISNANSCGDNCASLLAELSLSHDFSIYLAYPMDFGNCKFDMVIARTGTFCTCKEEFEKEYLLWRHNMT